MVCPTHETCSSPGGVACLRSAIRQAKKDLADSASLNCALVSQTNKLILRNTGLEKALVWAAFVIQGISERGEDLECGRDILALAKGGPQDRLFPLEFGDTVSCQDALGDLVLGHRYLVVWASTVAERTSAQSVCLWPLPGFSGPPPDFVFDASRFRRIP